MYGPFTNEHLVGRVPGGRRDEAVVATKFGVGRDADGRWLGFNSKPEYVRRACDALAALAADMGVTPAQLALAWVLAQGDDVVPIPGTKRRLYLEENVAAGEIELSADDLACLDEAFPRGAAAGDRYSDMSTIYR